MNDWLIKSTSISNQITENKMKVCFLSCTGINRFIESNYSGSGSLWIVYIKDNGGVSSN